VVPALRTLYDYAWFVGFGTAAVLHLALMKARAAAGIVTPSGQVGRSRKTSNAVSARHPRNTIRHK